MSLFFGSGMFGLFFFLIFGLLLFMVIITLVKGLAQWSRNNRSPRLTVWAWVVSRRVDVSHHHHPMGGDATGAHGYHTSTSTSYYVTFEVDSGDRMEFCVSGSEYGLLAEGDQGWLTFQGTRYLGFERAQPDPG